MTDHLEEYLRNQAPLIEDDDHQNLQRMALQEVLRLTTEAVRPAETQIKTIYQEALEQAEEKNNRDRKKIESQFQSQTEAARQKHQDQLEQIRTGFESDIKALENHIKIKLDNIKGGKESQELTVKKNYEYELMLADNVADGAIKRCGQERQEIKEAVPAAKNRLDTLRKQAETALRLYRYPLSSWDKVAVSDNSETDDVIAVFRKQHESARQYLDALYALRKPRLFIGVWPFFFVVMLCGSAVGLMWLLSFQTIINLPAFYVTGPIAGGVVLIITLIVGRILWRKAKEQINAVFAPFQKIVTQAHQLLDRSLKETLEQLDQQEQAAAETRKSDREKARKQYDSAKADITRRAEKAQQKINEEGKQSRLQLEEHRARAGQEADEEYQNLLPKLQQEHDRVLDEIQKRYQQEVERCQSQYDSARLLQERWQKGLSCIAALFEDMTRLGREMFIDWSDPSWREWNPANSPTSIVRFGYFSLDVSQLAGGVQEIAPFKVDPSQPVQLPALLVFPDRCSLLLQTQRSGREQAIDTLRAVMMRLLTSFPPGQVHFTIIDPVGLGENFAGFMHAADYKKALIGGRIWTDTIQIQQQLDDLTHHMENVIQKYLRNEFKTIEEYNLQAGELAEPYRFLVIADFPTNFNEDTVRRLGSIIHSGARCGVYTLIMYDARQELPPGLDVEDLASNNVHLVNENGGFVWRDRIFRKFPLTLDAPPVEKVLTDIMHSVGRVSREASRVEVAFEVVAPADNQYWTGDSSEELSVPIGRTGATRLQYFQLGRGMAQHMLIAGKTGSGKSTLLHVIITNLALWYSPDEVELYLIDFKKGVEFKTYVTHKLAHARTIAVESDREFGLSVLRRLEAEMTHRGDLFRQAGVQDIASYRQATGKVLPRTVLIVDEFQIFFSEDDRLAQDAALILEQLVRQGRAFGIHVLLGSQTLGGTANLARSTIGQMAVRIALQCSEADSQLILDDDNVAARLLSRPGEAIYNDAGGMVTGNSPYQTAWLPDSRRDEYLSQITSLAAQRPGPPEPTIVFEGNVPADIAGNRQLAVSLEQPRRPTEAKAINIWLGEPVSIKDPTAVIFRRQSGANLLIVGQRDIAALGLLSAAMVSIAAQHSLPTAARFVIFDGSPADSPCAGQLQGVSGALPCEHRFVVWRDVSEVINELINETQHRLQTDNLSAPAIYVLINGLQRYRVLRRQEDDFRFSMDAEAAPRPDKQFAELLREGPPVGVHILVWADTLVAVERIMDRQTMREFDNRVLFQMSAADSSNLIDSPIANQLGFHRALFYSDEQGILEKFRPYAPVEGEWLEKVRLQLKNKPAQNNPPQTI